MRVLARFWPRSLQGQVLLAVALALLFAQAISATLLWRAQAERREAALVHTAAMRLFAANRDDRFLGLPGEHPPEMIASARRLKVERSAKATVDDDDRLGHDEEELREILSSQGLELTEVAIARRPASDDPHLARRLARRREFLGGHGHAGPEQIMVASVRIKGSPEWLTVRIPMPGPDRGLIASLIGQTLLLYGILVGAIALILGRITRPLAALTGRLERFAQTPDTKGQMAPEGPDDVRRLIDAHNLMEGRIAALLDEKDVMLGAIGHDLKTPLAALRVRIESVEDEAERLRMAATIEDITKSLDDILSLARVGRPSDPKEPVDLSALVAQVVEEFEDMGEPITLTEASRIVVPLRATWLRRGLRNLVSNALRYGQNARVSLTRTGAEAVIRIDDDGPGIPEDQIERMQEPFTRGEPSRNSETGGAGLGLALARAIAEQHGGSLRLANRHGADGAIAGLSAAICLPLA